MEVLSPRETFLALTNRQEVSQSVPFLEVQIQDVLQGSTLFPGINLISDGQLVSLSQKSKYSSQKSVYTVIYHLTKISTSLPHVSVLLQREVQKSGRISSTWFAKDITQESK